MRSTLRKIRLVFALVIFSAVTFGQSQKTIQSAEYFWDTDPGEGNGIAAVALDGSFNEVLETAYEAALASPPIGGLHLFNIRVKDMDGNWGPVYKRTVATEDSPRNIRITLAEYFWDTDPGEGSATVMVAFDGAFDEALETALKNPLTTPATGGLHLFNVRVKDENGFWGPVFKRTVAIEDAPRNIKITLAEYFWDTDPGEGSATAMVAFDGAFDEALETALKNPLTTPATGGLHLFNIRVKDENGDWGPLFKRTVATEDTPRNIKITLAEYFWDTDPGEGSGTAMVAFDGNFNEALETALEAALGSPAIGGLHLFNVRVRDENGDWGPVYKRTIATEDSPRDIKITVAEYFWDTDPGEGSGTAMVAFDGNFNEALETALEAALASPALGGLHLFNVRVADENGDWGPVYKRTVSTEDSPRDIKITAGEYFWGTTDPGEGSGTAMVAFDGNFNESLETALTNSLSSPGVGLALFNVRVADENGTWGPLFKRTVYIEIPSEFLEIASAASENTICAGESVELTASGGVSYTWAPGATLSATSGATVTATPTVTTTYTVTGTGASGTTDTGTITVIVNPSPTASISGLSASYCINDDAVALTGNPSGGTFSGNGMSGNTFTPSSAGVGSHTISYTVSNAQGCSDTEITTANVINAPSSSTLTESACGSYTLNGTTYTSSGVYTQIIENTVGCDSTITLNLTVNPFPTPTISASGPTTFCSGGSVTLTSSSATDNVWSNGATTQSIVVTAGGNYTVTVTGTGGCSVTSAATAVTVNALPSAPIVTSNGPTTFCAGGSVTLTSSSSTGNVWSNGATTQSITLSTSGTYSVTVTNANGCSSTSTATTVTVNPVPATPSIFNSGPTTFCSGESVTLTSSIATGNVWSNGATTQSVTVNAAGTYTVSQTNAQGCTAVSSPVVVTVNANPPTPVISLNGPSTFCEGSSVTLTSSASSGNLWTTGATSNSVTISSNATVSVTVSDANGCSSTSSDVNIVVNSAPIVPSIFTSGPTEFCQGGSVTLTSSYATGNSWSNGETTQSIVVSNSGNYTVSQTNAQGCTSTSAVTAVVVNTAPSTPTIFASGPVTFCSGGSVTLTSSASSGNLWSDGSTSQSIVVTNSGNYSVTVTNVGGCSSVSSTVAVTVNSTPATPGIFASGSTTLCSGETVTLTSSSTSGNVWSNGATTQSVTVSAGGSYTVSNSNGSCTATSSPTIVTVNALPPAPSIAASGPTSFCSGGSVTLTSSSSTGNVWSNGATSQSIVVTNSGSYSVTVTNANGCSSSSTATVVSVTNGPAVPSVFTSGPTTFCSGGSVTLTSSTATGNIWSNGATTQSIVVSNSGSYFVTVSDGSGCTSVSATTAVTVQTAPATPVVTASGPTTFCSGNTVTLTSSATTGNVWSNGETTQSITVAVSGTYTVSVSNGTCTSVSAPTSITVNPAPVTPTVAASGPTTFCSGGSVTLTSSAATGNIWSNGVTTQSIVVSSSGSYFVTFSDGSGCTSVSATTAVTVQTAPATPVVTASGPTTFCSGNTVTLTSSATTGNVWSNGETTQSITVAVSGTYTVSVSNGTCSSVSSATTITVNPTPTTPTVAASGPTTFCSGGSVTLTSSAATGNIWSNGATTQSIVVSSSGSYFVTVSDGSGCTSVSATTAVTVQTAPATPAVTASGPTTFCSGNTVTLASSATTGNVWSNGETTQSITVAVSGTYTVSVSNGTCSSVSSATTITVNPTPTTPTVAASGPTTFCSGGSVTLTSSAATGNIWSNGATTQSIVVSSSGSYFVTVSDGSGCTSVSATTAVTVQTAPATPVVFASGPLVFCSGESVVLTSSSPTNNLWSNGATTQSITVTSTGAYFVTVDLGSGCQTTSTSTLVNVLSAPATPIIIAGGPASFCQGGSVTLTSSSATNNLWSNGATGQSITVNTSGAYIVSVTNAAGCTSSSAPFQVTVNQASSSVINENACNSYTLNGQTYFASGTYTQVINNVYGCDSTITLNLVIGTQPSSSTLDVVSCNSYTLNGTVYLNSGTFTQVVENSVGCDSTITLNLTIANPSTSELIVASCNSYNLNGEIYTASGTYTQVMSNVNGCDSTITLFLTIGTESSSSIISEVACGSYTAPDGQVFTSSGTYTSIIENAVGCDSVITINLTVNSIYSNTETVSACKFYTWSMNGITYSESGVYTINYSTVEGCDSSFVLDLTIENVNIGVDQIDAITLQSQATGDTYQWIDCTNGFIPIPGETNQLFIAQSNGSYAVIVTTGNCVDTSNCISISGVSIDEVDNSSVFVYPNPTFDMLYIDGLTNYEILEIKMYDSKGALVTERIEINETSLNLVHLARGIYHLVIQTDIEQLHFKVMKE